MKEDMQSVESDLHANQLLGMLAPETLRTIAPRLERVQLAVRAPLYEHGEPMTHAWFPAEGVLSVVAPAQTRVEVGTIGREGVLGIPLLLGAKHSVDHVFPQ